MEPYSTIRKGKHGGKAATHRAILVDAPASTRDVTLDHGSVGSFHAAYC